jgi:hypothetical protein
MGVAGPPLDTGVQSPRHGLDEALFARVERLVARAAAHCDAHG